MLDKSKSESRGTDEESAGARTSDGSANSEMKVLIVDDDPISRNIVRDILGARGFEVDGCENAQSALEKVRRIRYDLLILDLFLPHRDGRSLHNTIQSVDAELAQRTIFISHWEPAGAIADYVGENGLFLKKPFSAEDLLRAIQLATDASPRNLTT